MIITLFKLYPVISLLIVDDDSPDNTADVVEQMQQSHTNLHLVKRKGERGLALAYKEGLLWAKSKPYQYIFQMDCDFSHHPKQVTDLLSATQDGYHLVVGSRYIGGIRILNWPIKRLLLSYFASLYVRWVLNMNIYDPTSGFKCFTRQALETLDLDNIISCGYIFQVEVNHKLLLLGLNIKEVPITFYERKYGKSKMGQKIIWESFFSVLRLRTLHILNKICNPRKHRRAGHR